MLTGRLPSPWQPQCIAEEASDARPDCDEQHADSQQGAQCSHARQQILPTLVESTIGSPCRAVVFSLDGDEKPKFGCDSIQLGTSCVATDSVVMPQTEKILFRMQQQMLAEMSLVSKKLDNLAAHVGLDEAQLPQFGSQPGSERTSTPSFYGRADSMITQADSTITPSMQRQGSKLDQLRPKIRAIGAMIAAGKRASGENRNRKRRPSNPSVANARQEAGDASPAGASSKGIDDVVASVTSAECVRKSSMISEKTTASRARMKQIHHALREQTSRRGIRYKLWQFTESKHSSKKAFVYAGIWKLIVVSSILIAFLDTSVAGTNWDVAEIALECAFGAEFVLRLLCCPDRCTFLQSFFNLVDLLCILPLGARLLNTSLNLSPSSCCAIFCWVPFLRLLKLMRTFEKLQLLVQAFELALEALPSLLYTLAVLALFFAEVIYLVEPSESISSLPTALWYTIVTMTTVGYGDYTPTTVTGHVVASVLMIASALYMAMPLGIVGNAFSEVWGNRDHLLAMKRFRGAFLQGGFTLQAFKEIFSIFDDDGNGTLDIDEFTVMLRSVNMNISEDRVILLFSALDQEGAGKISFNALVDGLMPKAFARDQFDMLKSVSNLSASLTHWLPSWNPDSWTLQSEPKEIV